MIIVIIKKKPWFLHLVIKVKGPDNGTNKTLAVYSAAP